MIFMVKKKHWDHHTSIAIASGRAGVTNP